MVAWAWFCSASWFTNFKFSNGGSFWDLNSWSWWILSRWLFLLSVISLVSRADLFFMILCSFVSLCFSIGYYYFFGFWIGVSIFFDNNSCKDYWGNSTLIVALLLYLLFYFNFSTDLLHTSRISFSSIS